MVTISETVTLKVPVHTAYDQWTEFDEFPKIMNSVREVRRLEDQRLHWQDQDMAQEVDWSDALITDSVPDKYLVWQGTSGQDNTVAAQFDPLSAQESRVTVVVNFEPTSTLQDASQTSIQAVYGRVRRALDTFKDYVEGVGTQQERR